MRFYFIELSTYTFYLFQIIEFCIIFPYDQYYVEKIEKLDT